MSMRFKVEIVVDIDVNDWTEEYGTSGAAESLTQILGDLRERDNYLAGGKWADLVAYHWHLANPVAYDQPIPCRGQLGLWAPPEVKA